jgi:hypothetical protein
VEVKKFFSFLAIIVIALAAVALLEKRGLSTETTAINPLLEKVSELLSKNETLTTRLSVIEKSVATISAIPVKSPVNIKPMLEKANEALSKNDLLTAGFYFGNVIKQAQGEWGVLSQYHQSMQAYAIQLGKTEPEKAISLLSETAIFLRTQAIYLSSIQDLDNLRKALTEIDSHKKNLANVLASKVIQKKQQLFSESDALLKSAPVTVSSVKLEENMTALKSLDTELLNAEDIDAIRKKIAELEQFSGVVEKELANTRAISAINALVERANYFIKKALSEPAKSDFTLYYLASVDSIIRQLVLSESEINSDPTKAEVTKLSTQLEQAKVAIAEKQSELVWAKITRQSDKFNEFHERYKKSPRSFREQEGIDLLNKLYASIAENMGKLTSEKYVQSAKDLLQKINSDGLALWQESQRKFYDEYALTQIQTFYQEASKRLGIAGDDKDGIYADIMRYLSPIDTRLLSFNASTIYQEVFGKFYAKLADDNKIKISFEILSASKKKLSDF